MLATALLLAAAAAAQSAPMVAASVQGEGLRVEFDGSLRSRVVATLGVDPQPLGPFTDSENLRTDPLELVGFKLEKQTLDDKISDDIGSGTRVTLQGRRENLVKQVEVTAYRNRPDWLFFRVRYTNEGDKPVAFRGFINNGYRLMPKAGMAEPAFWAYQSSSHDARPDWIAPVPPGYESTNFLGMNDPDYGGGTPIVDVWRPDVGLAVGHIELVPKQVALPVRRLKDGSVSIALTGDRETVLKKGESFTTPRSFVAIHRGDFFATLRAYSEVMQSQGLKLTQSPKQAFDPIWCAWGYGRKFTPQQVFESLPVVKQLGFKWAVLDDGWQISLGDWRPRADKFPRGDADMKALVDRIHAAGLKAQLWWAPLGADAKSLTAREHPKWLLRNSDGSTRTITWWDSQYLCPAVPAVQADAAAFAKKALGEWGFDGLKIDGQHLNAAPPCYEKSHQHAHPDDAPEAMPAFFKAIWDSAQATKPGSIVEICPCGTGYSFFTLPYLNMTVASDPESSWQVRLKGKTLKALAGDRVAYFGDHVEMSEGGDDFASTFGVGGVIGTNFAWPAATRPGAPDEKEKQQLLLTPERQKKWQQWTKLYEEKRLSEGEYVGNLYDIGFDRPEAHVIRKGGSLYYAFFAPSYRGTLELRGLKAGKYQVIDYVSGKNLSAVEGPTGRIEAKFDHSLLLEARPRS